MTSYSGICHRIHHEPSMVHGNNSHILLGLTARSGFFFFEFEFEIYMYRMNDKIAFVPGIYDLGHRNKSR